MKKFLPLALLLGASLPAITLADDPYYDAPKEEVSRVKPPESPNKYTENTGMEDTPLVVIRFKEDNVMYQVPLYNAVKKAMRVYPGAFFEIVSVIPTTGNYQQDQESAMAAASNARKIMQSMTEMGLPAERYQTKYTTGAGETANEVRIFVR